MELMIYCTLMTVSCIVMQFHLLVNRRSGAGRKRGKGGGWYYDCMVVKVNLTI